MSSASQFQAAWVFFCLASAAGYADDVCPAPPKFTYTRPPDIAADDHRIHIETNNAELQLGTDLNAVLTGRVTVTQDQRTVSADSVTYDYSEYPKDTL